MKHNKCYHHLASLQFRNCFSILAKPMGCCFVTVAAVYFRMISTSLHVQLIPFILPA